MFYYYFYFYFWCYVEHPSLSSLSKLAKTAGEASLGISAVEVFGLLAFVPCCQGLLVVTVPL